MTQKWRLAAAAVAGLLAACQPAPTDAPTDAPAEAPERAEIEARLIPAVTIEGEDYSAYSLEERREVYRVPAVAVAVGRNGEPSWAGAYGAVDDAAGTRFQAASLSKTVAAAGILRLAAERGTGFDADLTGDLPMLDWEAINPEGRPVTLRGLLSHTAGATVGGFPGYSMDEEVPTNLEVIQGSDRTNTVAVVIDFDPDTPRRYAGGGYQIAQLWAETVSGEAFPELMRRLVLDPVGMEMSTFVQDRPEPDGAGYAFAHDGDGAPIEGGWHVYPELAAAGLWTTAPDYLRFALALMAAEGGDETVGIAPEVARAMSTPVVETFALGMGSEIRFEERRWRKGGSNRGYRSYVMMFPDRGDAIVVMTNGDNGFPMLGDINRTANQVYGWPAIEPRREEVFPIEPAALDRLAGTYLFGVSGDPILELTAGEGELSGRFNGGEAFRLVPISADVFIDPNDAQEVSFEVGEDAVTARSQGYVFTKPAD